mgnify:CR=1 FL=1
MKESKIEKIITRVAIVLMTFILIALVHNKISAQNFNDTVAYDSMEKYNWAGNWWLNTSNTGFAGNIAYSPPAAAYFYASGNNNSAEEYNWYSLPVIDTLDPSQEYKFKFHMASPRITSTGGTSGIDANDFLEVQVSRNGQAFVGEIQVKGNSNAYWGFNPATISKVVNGSVDAYGPNGGGDRTLTGDGISVVELIFPLGTTSIAIDIYTQANSNGEEFWYDDFFLLGSGSGTTLPITLTSFEACQVEQYVQIDFTVESQVNNEWYHILRSSDGYEYDMIGAIPGDGNSNTTMEYMYIDRFPLPGVSYYKLRQVDFDDNAEVFRAVSVKFVPLSTIDLKIIPNPAIDMISLEVADQDGTYFNHHVRIYDIEGNEVYNKLFIGENFNINVDVSKFKKGSYIVSDETNKANAVGKFIKK